jgi:hypothetical protein
MTRTAAKMTMKRHLHPSAQDAAYQTLIPRESDSDSDSNNESNVKVHMAMSTESHHYGKIFH